MDTTIFNAIQKLVGVSPVLDAIGVFCASDLIWVIAALLAIFWLLDRRRRTVAAIAALLAAAASWTLSQGIGLLYFRPRPFAVLANAHLLINKSPLDKSFPSDHASISFALAAAVFMVNRRWGWFFIVSAVLISLARIFVGVHYLSDVAAGALLGAVCAFLIHNFIHQYFHTVHHSPK